MLSITKLRTEYNTIVEIFFELFMLSQRCNMQYTHNYDC